MPFIYLFIFDGKVDMILSFDYMSGCYKGKVGLWSLGGESGGYGSLCKGKTSGTWHLKWPTWCLPISFYLS